MAETYTDLMIHIRYKPEGEQGYPVEATLSDGSFFSGRESLDEEVLRESALTADWDQYGQLLYKAVLAGGTISRAYDLARGVARQQSDGRLRVRLWLDSRAQELQQIRWELLQHNFNDDLIPLSTTGKMPFSCYTALGIAEPQPIKGRPLLLWLTATKVLGRLANRDDRSLLMAIVTENKLERYEEDFLEEAPLAVRFPKVKHRDHIRRRAIAVLADSGDQDTVAALLEAGVDGELSRSIYQATSVIYQRVG